MENSNSKSFLRKFLTNPLNSFVLLFVRNPINLLYAGLALVFCLFSYQNTFSKKPLETGFFSGQIEFGQNSTHRLDTKNISAQLKNEMGEKVLTLNATAEGSLESIYIKIFNLKGAGTYFIPGDGQIENIGNLIKNLDQYKDKNNFYEATLPNKDGIQNGVGRVNITKLTDTEIEGDLILIGNNPKGEQALLESAKFKISL
ncbi:hypothetical protein V7S79_11545 [Aquirufa sp. ROCK-SH2]